MGLKKLIKANNENQRSWEYIFYYVINYFILDIYKKFKLKNISQKIFKNNNNTFKNIIYYLFYFNLFLFLFSAITFQSMMIYHSHFDSNPYTFSETMNSNYIFENQHYFFNLPEEIKSTALINYKPLDFTNDNLISLEDVFLENEGSDFPLKLQSEESRYRLKNLTNFISQEKENYQDMKDIATNKNQNIIRRTIKSFYNSIPTTLLLTGWMVCYSVSLTYHYTLDFHDTEKIERFITFHYLYNSIFLLLIGLMCRDFIFLFYLITLGVIFINYKRFCITKNKYENFLLPY